MLKNNFEEIRLIDGPFIDRVKVLIILSRGMIEELEWWFELYIKNKDSSFSDHLKKPICIEIFELTWYLEEARKLINRSIRTVKEMEKANGRESQLNPVGGADTIRKWRDELREYRNCWAAHRFSDKAGEYITLNQLINLGNSLGWEKLKKAIEELSIIHQKFEEWYNDEGNQGYLEITYKVSL